MAQILSLPKPSAAVVDGHRRRDATHPGWPQAVHLPALATWLAQTQLTLVSAAEWSWEEGRSIARRSLPTATLGWQCGGEGEVIVAGQRFALPTGSLLAIPSGTWHQMRHRPGHPLRSLGVHFQAPLLGGASDLMELMGIPRVVPLEVGRDEPITEAMSQLVRLAAHRPAGWQEAGRAELIRILMHLVLHHGGAFRAAAPAIPRAPGRLTPLLARIERELPNGPLVIEDLAREIGLSAVHLRTLFREVTGISPARYIQQRRVALACRLLRQSEASVADVAHAVGIPEARVFHRLFRRISGTTPQRWRWES